GRRRAVPAGDDTGVARARRVPRQLRHRGRAARQELGDRRRKTGQSSSPDRVINRALPGLLGDSAGSGPGRGASQEDHVEFGDIGLHAADTAQVDVPVQYDALPDGTPSVMYGDVTGYAEYNHQQGDNPYGFQED